MFPFENAALLHDDDDDDDDDDNMMMIVITKMMMNRKLLFSSLGLPLSCYCFWVAVSCFKENQIFDIKVS